jgi:glycerol uptake facilitator-like aquaporin
MTFIITLAAAFIGATAGQALCLWVVGGMAQRAERKKAEEIHKAMFEFNAAMEAEKRRMQNYAKMEG